MSEENSINLKVIDGIFQASNWNIEPTITILGVTYTASEFNKAVEMLKQPQLNENQQIVLEWLKGSYVQGYGPAVIRTIHLLQKENTVDITDSSYVRRAYRALNTVEEAVVVKMFADWALEQEEEK